MLTLGPLAAATIAAEARLARWWPLPFPRSIAELEEDPHRLVDLLTRPSRGLLAPLTLPAGAAVSVRRVGGLLHEPDKDRTVAILELVWQGDAGEQVIRVVAKFQSGRGMPLYVQAIRAVLESGFSREIAFYRHLASAVPVRVARPLFADAVTTVNRVCLVVEYVESVTPPDRRGCPLPAMRALLADAARLNAYFLDRLDDPSVAWIPARSGLDFASFVTGFIKRAEPDYREVWSGLQRYFDGRPVTLVHGDCRPGNMLFTGDASIDDSPVLEEHEAAPWPDPGATQPGVVMSDWEGVNVAPLLWDFTYATIIGLRVGDRRAWLDRLLDEFLAWLAGADLPGDPLDRSQCRLEVDLLAWVLAYISLVVYDHRLWSGQGNASGDIRAWGSRLGAASASGDPRAMGAALGIAPDTIGRVRDQLARRLTAIGQ